MAEENQVMDSAKAVAAFGIITGAAGGIASLAISSRFGNKEVTTNSVITAIAVSAIATIGAVFLIKELSHSNT